MFEIGHLTLREVEWYVKNRMPIKWLPNLYIERFSKSIELRKAC